MVMGLRVQLPGHLFIGRVEELVGHVDRITVETVEVGITQMQHGVGKRAVMERQEQLIRAVEVGVELGMVGMELVVGQVL